MNRRLAAIAERRRQLVARSAAQRIVLAADMIPWRTHLARVDRGIAVVRYVRSRPALWLGGALLLAALRPRRFGVWLQRGWLAWQIGRRLR